MDDVVGIYEITIDGGSDVEAFEEVMKEEVFPQVRVGQATRAGTVTAQYLLQRSIPRSENEFAWLVQWTEAGGSPFGSEGAPDDPKELLERFGAETNFRKFVVVAEERS